MRSFNITFPKIVACGLFSLLASGCATTDLPVTGRAATQTYYTTKTPYAPRQDWRSYETPPAGFYPVHTQLVARHGSRGMTSPKADLALFDLWQQAEAKGALTPLGRELGSDLRLLMRTNALLGYGVDGIGRPGYGNLSLLGVQEHRLLAERMSARMSALFDSASSNNRRVVVLSSGVDRARDSAYFFKQSLIAQRPKLAERIEEPVLTGYPHGSPIAQSPGINRFLLYFHKLNAKTDWVASQEDPYFDTYQQSLRYQRYHEGNSVKAKLDEILADPAIARTGRAVVEGLFKTEFVNELAAGRIRASNQGSFTFVSDDGKFTARVTGDGKTVIASVMDTALAISSVYEIAPGLRNELGRDFRRYIPDEHAKVLAYPNDAEDFYVKGPGILEDNPVTYEMATLLLTDFFNELTKLPSGDYSNIAKLRFTHAEIIVPFASLLGLEGVFQPVPKAQTYRYDNNAWRGEDVAPYSANVQWDSYRNAEGRVILRMLYNERETSFARSCDIARVRGTRFYYDALALKACYAQKVEAAKKN